MDVTLTELSSADENDCGNAMSISEVPCANIKLSFRKKKCIVTSKCTENIFQNIFHVEKRNSAAKFYAARACVCLPGLARHYSWIVKPLNCYHARADSVRAPLPNTALDHI